MSRALKSAISLAMSFLILALAPGIGGYRAFADTVFKTSTGRSSNTRWMGAPGGYAPAVGVEDPYNYANEISFEALKGDIMERTNPYQPILSQDNVVPAPDAILDDSGLVADPRQAANSRYNVLGQKTGVGAIGVIAQPGSAPASTDRVQRLTSGQPLVDTVSNLDRADAANTLEKMWTAGSSGILQSGNFMKGVVSAITGRHAPAWLGLKAQPAQADEAKTSGNRFNVESLVLNGSGNGLANGVVAQTISAAQKREIARVVEEVGNAVGKSGNDKGVIYQSVIDRINSIQANRLGAPIPDIQQELREYLLLLRDNSRNASEFKTAVGELFKSVSSLAESGRYSKPIFNPLLLAAGNADEASAVRPTGLIPAVGEKKSFYQESYRAPEAPKAAFASLHRETAGDSLWTLGLGSLVVASFAFAGAQATLLAAAGAVFAAWMFRPKLAAAPAYYFHKF